MESHQACRGVWKINRHSKEIEGEKKKRRWVFFFFFFLASEANRPGSGKKKIKKIRVVGRLPTN